ncbi:MAG: DUF1326 domain-containing protein [Chthoniobacterales bacterium]
MNDHVFTLGIEEEFAILDPQTGARASLGLAPPPGGAMLFIMKALVVLLFTFVLALSCAVAADMPQGRVIEVHAVEVYTGGCTASAQATMGGRSMLRVWSFENGTQDGIALRGLQVAALHVAEKNLAVADTEAKSAVVYLPERASETQRRALVNWLKSSELANTPFKTRLADIKYAQKDARITLEVGKQIALKTREIQKCDAGACGEALWYQPRSKVADYTVVVNESSSVNEPALLLVWKDNSAKSVFVGRFGVDAKPEFHLAAVE